MKVQLLTKLTKTNDQMTDEDALLIHLPDIKGNGIDLCKKIHLFLLSVHLSVYLSLGLSVCLSLRATHRQIDKCTSWVLAYVFVLCSFCCVNAAHVCKLICFVYLHAFFSMQYNINHTNKSLLNIRKQYDEGCNELRTEEITKTNTTKRQLIKESSAIEYSDSSD